MTSSLINRFGKKRFDLYTVFPDRMLIRTHLDALTEKFGENAVHKLVSEFWRNGVSKAFAENVKNFDSSFVKEFLLLFMLSGFTAIDELLKPESSMLYVVHDPYRMGLYSRFFHDAETKYSNYIKKYRMLPEEYFLSVTAAEHYMGVVGRDFQNVEEYLAYMSDYRKKPPVLYYKFVEDNSAGTLAIYAGRI